MKSPRLFSLIIAHGLGASSVYAGDESLAADLLREASVAKISGGSAKDAFVPDRLLSSRGWRFSVSPSLSYQYFGKVGFDAAGRNTSAGLPSLVGPEVINLPDIGDGGLPGNRTYDDGFVNLTGPTADTGRTWFWGYDHASQIDTSGNLTMNATGLRRDFRESYTAAHYFL
jgi:hypothetical protein